MGIWHYLFWVLAYGSALLCIVHALRQGWPDALVEILIFVLMIVFYWLLESWAEFQGDFYFYPPVFGDMIDYFPFANFPLVQPGGALCPWLCAAEPNDVCPPISGKISLSIPVLESSLTFVTMWTARLLAPKLYLLWPFLVGLAVLAMDMFLDPIASTTAHCQTKAAIWGGLGFWEWRVFKALPMPWFGIPLFNYAAWFFAPIAAVSGALLIHWARDFFVWLWNVIMGNPATPPSLTDLLLRALLFWAAAMLFALSPLAPGAPAVKIATMVIILIWTVIMVYRNRNLYVHDNGWSFALVAPQVAIYLFSLLALLLSATHPIMPLLPAGVVCTVLGMWYATSPYVKIP